MQEVLGFEFRVKGVGLSVYGLNSLMGGVYIRDYRRAYYRAY